MRASSLFASCVLFALVASPAWALLPASWAEVGDAGGPVDPQVMFGDGSVRTIIGDIGGDDVIDVFTFHFTQDGAVGSLFAASVEVAAGATDIDLFLHLLTEDGRRIALGDGSVRVEDLLTGFYHIGISTLAFDNFAAIPDPPYIVTFDIGDTRFVPTPEPQALGLLALGLVGLALRRRRG